MTCTFNDSQTADDSISQCVALVSNKRETTSKYGLLHVGVYNFTRIGDTAGGCLPEVNITDQWIDIFAYRDNRLASAPTSLSEITNGE